MFVRHFPSTYERIMENIVRSFGKDGCTPSQLLRAYQLNPERRMYGGTYIYDFYDLKVHTAQMYEQRILVRRNYVDEQGRDRYKIYSGIIVRECEKCPKYRKSTGAWTLNGRNGLKCMCRGDCPNCPDYRKGESKEE